MVLTIAPDKKWIANLVSLFFFFSFGVGFVIGQDTQEEQCGICNKVVRTGSGVGLISNAEDLFKDLL
ncbi:hypothetical protein ACFL27_10790 [candidate division CSSED10-310 bacterium]|uniref:Uncharacterized protein n=1 Tax=candidate division CSSED10-310 bacterium TaxID=2855610 RepID=A0ABV6YWW7_UNCC1